jgi:hypothetical protein
MDMAIAALVFGAITGLTEIIKMYAKRDTSKPKTNGTTKADLEWQKNHTSHDAQVELLKEVVKLNRSIILNVSACPRMEPHHGSTN